MSTFNTVATIKYAHNLSKANFAAAQREYLSWGNTCRGKAVVLFWPLGGDILQEIKFEKQNLLFDSNGGTILGLKYMDNLCRLPQCQTITTIILTIITVCWCLIKMWYVDSNILYIF